MLITGGHGQYTASDQAFQRGGQAELFRIAGSTRLIYKRYRESLAGAADMARLQKLVTIGRSVMNREIGAFPESSVNWPLDLVTGRGGVQGVVIPEIPARFYRSDGSAQVLDFLVFARADPPESSTRILVLIRIAEIFSWLHSHELIYGDFSGKNVVWSTDPQPAAYLIDADPIQSIRAPAQRGVATPWWGDPRLTMQRITAQDQYSDWWGLALAIYRGLWLTPGALMPDGAGAWAPPSDFPRGLAPQVRSLIERSLDANTPGPQRASPAEWISALTSAFIVGNRFNSTQIQLLNEAARSNDPRQRARARQAAPPAAAVAPTPTPAKPPVGPPAAPRAQPHPEPWLRRHIRMVIGTGVTAAGVLAYALWPRPAGAAPCVNNVLASIPPPVGSPPAKLPGFHAAYYGQSGYVEACSGALVRMTVQFYNSGSTGWVRAKERERALIGTWNPDPGQDKASQLGGDGTHGTLNTGWVVFNRPAMQSTDYVGPGQVGWFFFDIRAPSSPGTYVLAIRPVIDGVTWMEDAGVQWLIRVK